MTLGDVADITSGVGFPPALQGRTTGDYPVAKVGDVSRAVREGDGTIGAAGHWINYRDLGIMRAKVLPTESILFAKIGESIRLNFRALTTRELVVDNNVMAVIPRKELVDPKFLLNWMRSQDWYPLAVATSIPSLRKSDLAALPFALPELEEQRRLVATLERRQARSREARAALDAVPQLLEKLRQSILAAAFRGDLTKDWRAKNPNVEPASVLLDRIRAERRKKWEESELAKMGARGKAPSNDNWKRRYTEAAQDHADSSDLPCGWSWSKLGELGADPFNAVQTGPFGAMLHNTEFVSEGVPVVAVGNLTGTGFRRDGLYFVTKEKADELSRFDVQSGDVLFARSGATTGKVAIAPPYVRDWRMTGHILRLRLDASVLMPEMAVFALTGSPAVKRQVVGNIRGATRPGYNTSLLEEIRTPVPPLEEQRVMLARVTVLLEQAARLQRHSDELSQSLSTLDRATLGRAFTGQLSMPL